MASLTATANNLYSFVSLYIDFDAFNTLNQVTVIRIHPDGTEYVVRGGYRITTFPVTFDYYLTDTEMPLDTPITYRAFEDVVGLDPSTTVVTGGPVTVVSSGYQWFKDPARPWADVRVDLCPQSYPCSGIGGVSLLQLGSKTRASDANIIPVLDRELPADIWARRKGIVSSLAFLTRVLPAIGTVYTLFTAGGPLLVQLQPAYGWDDAYWQPGELAETPTGSRDQRVPIRRWTVPIVQVDRPSPSGAAQGTVCSNWCVIEDTYATSQALADTGLSWLDVANCDAVASPLTGYGFGPYGFGPYGG